MKQRILSLALWAAYLLALGSSISHVAWTFNTLEQPGHEWAGWLAALAVDCGLAALAYAIQQRKRAGRNTRGLWAGVLAFAAISAYANALHALNLSSDVFTAVVLSSVLPLMVVYLGEVVSSDDNAALERAERERQRLERERQRAEVAEAKRLAEAEAQQRVQSEARAVQAVAVATIERWPCDHCEFTATSRNALNAHKRVHSNGHAVEVR